ncbi:MAG: TonB-dependent receptor, partial [Pyrinomonadaceae bacterium]
IYYGPGQTEDQIQPIESDRISSTVSSGALLAFPANIQGIIDNFNNNPNNRNYQPRAYSSNYKIPERIFQYSFSWQQQLPYNLVSTIAYVGSQGRNLFLRSTANKILPGATSILDGTNIPTGVGVVNRLNASGQVIGVNTIREFAIVSGTSVQNPYAEVDYKTSGGDDRYNALQFSLQRSFSTGLTMNAQYTFGKSEGLSSGSNEARTSAQLDNFEADRGRNNFDVRHTFNLSALYELPFGKGKRWEMGSVGNALLGGWEVGGIYNARSGVPIEVLVVRPDVVIQCTNPAAGCVAGQVRSLPGTVNAANPLPAGFTAVVNTPGGGASRNVRRPNLIPGVSPYLDNDRNFLNPAAFSIPEPGEYGNLPRNFLSGPNFRQLDMIFAKRFRFSETMNFEFRTEIFNILNQANFSNPSATLSNALSSTFQPGQPFTQSTAGSTFGLLRSTVGRTVGLGTNRQVQFAFRFNF